MNHEVRLELNGVGVRELEIEHKEIWDMLEKENNKVFLTMSEQDEKNIKEKGRQYKLHKKKYACLSFCFKNMSHQNAGTGIKDWLKSFSAIKYFYDILCQLPVANNV